MEAFPAFFPLAGRRVVVAGEGDGAEAKARLLAGSPATVLRVSGKAAHSADAYASAVLAFVASPDADFCATAAKAARAAGVPVNVVDHPELCDFHTPGIIDRGQVVVGIGTGGAAPVIAARLRAELEALIPVGFGEVARQLGELRAEAREKLPDLDQRRAFFYRLLDGPWAAAAERGDETEAFRIARAALADPARGEGRIWLVAEPASLDLVSLRAARVLSRIDLVVLDDPDHSAAALVRRDAPRRALKDVDAEGLAKDAAAGRQVAVIAPTGELALLAVVLADLGAPHEALAAAPA